MSKVKKKKMLEWLNKPILKFFFSQISQLFLPLLIVICSKIFTLQNFYNKNWSTKKRKLINAWKINFFFSLLNFSYLIAICLF